MFQLSIKSLREKAGITQTELARRLGVSQGTVGMWESGRNKPSFKHLEELADLFGVSWDEIATGASAQQDFSDYAPRVTEDVVTFSIIGEVAAGYDHMPVDVDGERIDIPRQYLHGRPMSDFFVLRVKGDSMYPSYQDGDLVLVLRQSTCNRSGDVAVVIYGDEAATLKKVEYVTGEDWLKLIPLNPLYPPVRVENERLEHCRVLGLPKMLIREIKD